MLRNRASFLRRSLFMGMSIAVCGSSLANNAISDITWTLGPDMPGLRKGGAMGVVNGTIVYAGGSESATVYETSTTFGYVPGAGSWTNVATLPQARAYFDGINVDDQLFAVNGRIGGYAGTTLRTILRLRYQSGSFVWDNFGGQQTALSRAYYTVGKLGTKIYSVAGGRFANGQPVDEWNRQVKDADVFDAANSAVAGSAIPSLPGIERFHPVTVGVAGKLYVFGGTNIGAPGAGYESDRLSDAYVFDPSANSWSNLPSLPFGYAGGSAEVYKDRFIILTGGVAETSTDDQYPDPDPGFYNNMVMVYDTRYGTYDILPSLLPEATGDIRTVIIGDKVYAAGGETKGPLFNSNRLRIGQLHFGPGEWDSSVDASWNDLSNWSTSVPNGIGSIANFLEKITAPRTVLLDAPVTAGYVLFQNANSYTISGTGTLTLQVPSSDGFISLSGGSHSILAPMRMVSPMKVLGPGTLTTGNITNNATLTIQTTVNTGAIDGPGRTIIAANRTLTAAGVKQSVVDLNGTLAIPAGRSVSKTSVIGTLNIGASARFDLGDNDLVLNYSGASPVSTVRSQIISGYANGAWNGLGINSSVAAVGGSVRTALGYADASTLSLGTFSGQALDGTAVIVRFTAAGDANLDGQVNSIDFTRFIAGYGMGGSIWINGDFDYNGKVNSVDFNLLSGNFGAAIPSSTLGSIVPEPGAALLALLGAAMCIRTRVRRVLPLLVLLMMLLPVSGAFAQADEKPAITPQALLDPAMFPDAQFGMEVSDAKVAEGIGRVTTTGAVIEIDSKGDVIRFKQRIPLDRDLASIQLPAGAAKSLQLAHHSSGAAIFKGDGAVIRINCESLAMIQTTRDCTITARLAFTPDYHSRFKGNYNFFDPQGGMSFYENGYQPSSDFRAAKDPVTVSWKWKAGDVFWAGVNPPRPFNWDESISKRVLVWGSSEDRHMYPSDTDIKVWSRHSNVLYLHNETAWEHWQLSLVPRDLTNFKRVMATAEENGMQTIVYASPHFFTRGTYLESRANPDPHIGTGQFTGANVDEYLKQAGRIVREFGSDGLYFDEMYPSPDALATQYYLTRKSRELVGDAGLLYLHCTTDILGDTHGGIVCPSVHTYFNTVYKGEGEWDRRDPAYTRYVLSTYNTSNAVGVQIVDERYLPTPENMDFWMRHANSRFFLPGHYLWTDQADVYRNFYWPRLNGSLGQLLEPDLLRPTGVFEQFRKSIGEASQRN